MNFLFVLATLVAVSTAQQQCCAPQPVQIQLFCGANPPAPPPQEQCYTSPPATTDSTTETDFTTEPITDTTIFETTTEGPANEAVFCDSDNDMALVIDSSTSWGINTYKGAIDFAAQFARTWRENPGNGVAVCTFATEGKTPVQFDNSISADEIYEKIQAIPWDQGNIRVDLGLDEARRALAGTDRKNIPKNIVLFTDAVTDDWNLLLKSLEEVEKEGQRMFVVAMGHLSAGNNENLKKIALGHEDHIFHVETTGGDALLGILRDISKGVCSPDLPAGR